MVRRLAMRLSLSTSSCLIALTTVLAASGCKEEDTRLFDENGVWALEKYALDGGVFTEIQQVRKNVFLLNFNPDDGVVAVAGCFGSPSEGLDNSTCTVNPINSFWDCRCFAYEYDKSRMVWQEFEPGETPPPVSSPSVEGSPSTEVLVDETDAARTYEFSPLPEDLFDSDGQIAKYVFVQRSPTIWDNNDVKPEMLQACSASCFPSVNPE